MQKDFDGWNISKKQLNNANSSILYQEREVWWCALGTNIGFEQDGTGKNRDRPVLILKGFSRNVCLIIPLTTSTKTNKYHSNCGSIGGKSSFAIISQLRLIDTRRLVRKIVFLDKNIFETIRKSVKDML